MATSLLDPTNIETIREFVKLFGQGMYERMCDRFAGNDAALIDKLERAVYGNKEEACH